MITRKNDNGEQLLLQNFYNFFLTHGGTSKKEHTKVYDTRNHKRTSASYRVSTLYKAENISLILLLPSLITATLFFPFSSALLEFPYKLSVHTS